MPPTHLRPSPVCGTQLADVARRSYEAAAILQEPKRHSELPAPLLSLFEAGTIEWASGLRMGAVAPLTKVSRPPSVAVPQPGPSAGTERFTFIELFAGIGGFRIALQVCARMSDWETAEAARRLGVRHGASSGPWLAADTPAAKKRQWANVQEIGGRCVFASEIDAEARDTYATNFGDEPSGECSSRPPARP
jgi:hypothetical protein